MSIRPDMVTPTVHEDPVPPMQQDLAELSLKMFDHAVRCFRRGFVALVESRTQGSGEAVLSAGGILAVMITETTHGCGSEEAAQQMAASLAAMVEAIAAEPAAGAIEVVS